ncbi:proto-oncogene Mas-like [Sceloporus undulatus]|uniref:proto-oncogene Mas-like n=1 Tax=Sceloporus undulatus TaxID=8520 RepID=UPI001C4C8DAC|nr:proto-oncogene Mas-like [Sceloporus undulatus]
MLIYEMENNTSDYGNPNLVGDVWEWKNRSDPVPRLHVEKIWPHYVDISNGGSHPLTNIMDHYNGFGGSGNSLTPYSDINGAIGTWHPINDTNDPLSENITIIFINSFIVIICLLGIVGNGMVIWLLGFRMKRNPFTTYILNLSIADFGVLIFLICTASSVTVDAQYNRANVQFLLFSIFFELFFFTYSTGQCLLAAISIDRCLAVLFPLWHRCHRPSHLSSIVCTLIWIFYFLLSGIHFTLHSIKSSGRSPLLYLLILNVVLCTPIMVTFTLTLVIHVSCKSEQRQQGKLVTVILLTLLFFLLFALPLNVIYIFNYYYYYKFFSSLMVTGFACSSLNSSINPLIYFLVGRRQKKGQPRASMKVALQRVFKDEQDSREEQNTTNETLV